jgi:pre-mRNA-splicing factor 38B
MRMLSSPVNAFCQPAVELFLLLPLSRPSLAPQYYFETILPRIPKPVQDHITEELKQRSLPTAAKMNGGQGGADRRGVDDAGNKRPASVKASLSVAFGQRAPNRAGAREEGRGRDPSMAQREAAAKAPRASASPEPPRDRDRRDAPAGRRDDRDGRNGADRSRDFDRDRRGADYDRDRRGADYDRDRRTYDRRDNDDRRDRDRERDRDRGRGYDDRDRTRAADERRDRRSRSRSRSRDRRDARDVFKESARR